MKFDFNTAYTNQARDEDQHVEGVFTDEAGEYIVEKHSLASRSFEYRLAIKREDREPIRSWRILQDIKNAVVGVDRTAVEIYPLKWRSRIQRTCITFGSTDWDSSLGSGSCRQRWTWTCISETQMRTNA